MLANHTTQALTIGSLDAVKLQQIVLQSLPDLDTIRGKELVLVVGRTKSGKSTAINYLMGAKLVKYTADDGEILAKLAEGQVEYAPIGSTIEAHTLAPRGCTDVTEGITYCDTAGFDDNRSREYRVCAVGFMQTGIQVATAIKMLAVTIDVGLLYADPNMRELRALAEILSNITQDISKFSKNLMFILTKTTDQSVPQVITRIKKLHVTLEQRLVNEDKVLDTLMVGFRAGSVSTDALEQRENEMRIIHAEAMIIQLINVNNTFFLDVFDSGESRQVVINFLKIQKTNDPIPKKMFNFKSLTSEWIGFNRALNQLASEAANLLERRLLLPAQVWTEKENLADTTRRIAHLQNKLAEDNIDPEEFERHRVRNLEILTKMKKQQECCVSDIVYLQALSELLKTDNTLIRIHVLGTMPMKYSQEEYCYFGSSHERIDHKNLTCYTLNYSDFISRTAAEPKYISISERLDEPTPEFLRLWEETRFSEAEKRTVLGLECLPHLSQFLPFEKWTGPTGGAVFGYLVFEYADRPYDNVKTSNCLLKDQVMILARKPQDGLYRAVTQDWDSSEVRPVKNLSFVKIEFYSFARNFPDTPHHMMRLNRHIVATQKMLKDFECEIPRLEKFQQFASARMACQQELAGCTTRCAELTEEITTLEEVLIKIREKVNTNARMYDILFSIAPLSNSSAMREFVEKYTKYKSLSVQERDDGLFLAMHKFYINPDNIDWSANAKRLGRGGAAEVYKRAYKAAQNHAPTDVAVKQIFANTLTSALVQEAQLMTNFRRHPNIVHFYGITQSRQSSPAFYAIVMECMKCSLSDILYDTNNSDQMLSLEWRMKIASQIVAAIIYLHEASVLHRDIKSHNIVLSNDHQTAKLTDFGISKSIAAVTNTVIGSPCWMAPELSETGATKATDIFALGIVIAEIVNRKLPFDGRILPPNQYRDKIQAGLLVFSDKFPMLSSLGRDCIKIAPVERPTAQQCQARLSYEK